FSKVAAGAVTDGRRTGDVSAGQMLHQPQEKGQITGGNPFFIERQNVRAARGVDDVVRVFDAFGDALVGEQLADVVAAEEVGQVIVADFGINRHWSVACP